MNRQALVTSSGLLALALTLAAISACNDDSSDMVMTPSVGGPSVLHYDGPHDASPTLPGGATYEAAARFTSTQTTPFMGDRLTEVQFYIQSIPDSCRVKIYGAGTATAPGAPLYVQDVTSSVVGGSWNTHVLTSDVTLSGDDLWISVEFHDASTQPTIGCDPGPAVPDGNWLYNSNLLSWSPFSVSVNWNIRGVVEVTP